MLVLTLMSRSGERVLGLLSSVEPLFSSTIEPLRYVLNLSPLRILGDAISLTLGDPERARSGFTKLSKLRYLRF
jgi:hypothetical protein